MDRQDTLDRLSVGVFVGRADDLMRLRRAHGDAKDKHPRVVGIAGEPGVGKSRLAQAIAQQAQADGWWVHTIQCIGGEAAPAYWAWKQLVRAGLDGADAVAPDLFAIADRFVVAERLAGLLREAAEQAPLVVVLEDLHESDEASLHLLPLVTAQLGAARVLLVFTYRDGDAEQRPALAGVVAQLREPVAERLALRGLDPEATKEMITTIAGQRVPRAFAARLHELSGGNPLFLRELLRHLIERDVIFHDGTRWTSHASIGTMPLPSSLQEILRDRLERLSPDCRTLLQVGALFRGDFDVSTIRRLELFPAERVLAAADEALRARLIVSAERPPGRYRFGHGVFREHLRGAMPFPTRAGLHRSIAAVLEPKGTTPGDGVVFELAYHLLQAGLDGDPPRALAWAGAAAKRSAEQGGYERAAEYYIAALTLGDAAGLLDVTEQFELLIALAEVRHHAGDRAKARLTATAAARLARRHARPDALARAALAFSGRVRGFGSLGFDAEAVTLLEEAWRAMQGRDEHLTAVVEARLAEELSFGDERMRERRSDLARTALGRARRLGDPATLAAVLRSMHWALWTPEQSPNRLGVADEIIRLATEAGDDDLMLEGHALRSLTLIELGDAAGARIALAVAKERAGARPYGRWVTACIDGCLALMSGDLDAVDTAARRAHEVSIEAGVDSGELMFGAQGGHIWWLRGPLDALEPLLRDLGRAIPIVRPTTDCALIATRAEAGAFEDARRDLERLATDGFAGLPRNALWLSSMTFLAVACAELGDDVRAEELYALLEPFAEQTVLLPPVLCLGSMHHFLGLLATTAGEREAARRHYELAITANSHFGTHQWTARTQVAYAGMLLATAQPSACDRELARVLLLRARDLGSGLHMERVVDRADELLRLTGEEPTYQLVQIGDAWELVFGTERALLRNLRGFYYLRELLRRPFECISCATLYAAATHDGLENGTRPIDLGNAGPACDARTQREVLNELRRIRNEMTEREMAGEDCEALREEARKLDAYLRSSKGRSGIVVLKDSRERFRQSVWQALRSTLAAIRQVCPRAADYLAATIQRGWSCRYVPDPQRVPRWKLD